MLVITSNPVIATSQVKTIKEAVNIALEFSKEHNLVLKTYESMTTSLEHNKRLKVGYGQTWLTVVGTPSNNSDSKATLKKGRSKKKSSK